MALILDNILYICGPGYTQLDAFIQVFLSGVFFFGGAGFISIPPAGQIGISINLLTSTLNGLLSSGFSLRENNATFLIRVAPEIGWKTDSILIQS